MIQIVFLLQGHFIEMLIKNISSHDFNIFKQKSSLNVNIYILTFKLLFQ